jgi:hypothetical protein
MMATSGRGKELLRRDVDIPFRLGGHFRNHLVWPVIARGREGSVVTFAARCLRGLRRAATGWYNRDLAAVIREARKALNTI